MNVHERLPISFVREGVVLRPNGDAEECEGVLNPATARARNGQLLMYPRVVAEGNISRIGLVEIDESTKPATYQRVGYALEPKADYELRTESGGYGCEDPRVTFIAAIDMYIMIYAAYGPTGPRLAIAISSDAYSWQRLGLMNFAPGLPNGVDKDGAFFPQPVLSPRGVVSLAFYHRPMNLTAPPIDPIASAPGILALPPEQREGIRIGYMPLEAVLADIRAILDVVESVNVVSPNDSWGRIKIGAGTPPIKVGEAWFSLYHGVDVVTNPTSGKSEVSYSVAALFHDLQSPHIVTYTSPEPIWFPENADELEGTVNNVVFPTAIEPCRDGVDAYDVYYGMADARIGKMRLAFAPGR